ncbi:MAG: hypothetical protein GY928_00355 [Colwellia sp.]|nr:hypothetical protein [Colwellia sp.]
MKDKLKSKMVWKDNKLLVDRQYLGCINSHGINNWQVWVGFTEAMYSSTKEQAKEAAEQAVIDWFERVLG